MASINKRNEQKERRNVMRTLTLITQLGISMLVPIFLCFFTGYYLDKWLGTNYIIIIAFFIGAISGFRNVYVLVMRTMKNNDRKDDE